MAKFHPALTPELTAFIARQTVFFVASAAAGARINLSPKDAASLRVLGPNEVAYLDQTGSGNETAAHLAADGRLTFMLCSFQGPPLILRLYGRGSIAARGGGDYRALLEAAFDGAEPPGARQIVRLAIESVQTSCGYGVPLLTPGGDRDNLRRWAEHKGEDGLKTYRAAKNRQSIDGLPTGLAEE